MAERALPQASRKNVLRVFRDLLQPDVRTSFSTRQLAQDGYGQARHAHALLTFLGFLEGDQPNHDVKRRRKDPQDFANWLRQAMCSSYAPRLGDVNFLFDEPNRETARSLARHRVEQASEKSARPLLKRNIAQVVDCMLTVRDVHRYLKSGRTEWLREPEAAAPKVETQKLKPRVDPAANAGVYPSPHREGAAQVTAPSNAPPQNGQDSWASASGESSQGNPTFGTGAETPTSPLEMTAASDDLLSRLVVQVSNSKRRFKFHAKHVEIKDASRTQFSLADVDITIE